jgi:hypothetical protein
MLIIHRFIYWLCQSKRPWCKELALNLSYFCGTHRITQDPNLIELYVQFPEWLAISNLLDRRTLPLSSGQISSLLANHQSQYWTIRAKIAQHAHTNLTLTDIHSIVTDPCPEVIISYLLRAEIALSSSQIDTLLAYKHPPRSTPKKSTVWPYLLAFDSYNSDIPTLLAAALVQQGREAMLARHERIQLLEMGGGHVGAKTRKVL